MTGGVFAVSRGIFDDPDFAPEPFTQREAFMWLVASSAWKELTVRGAYGRVNLRRGEFCFSVRFLAERWKWSKSRVARFLSMLENRDIIRDAKRDTEQVWIVNKYNDFQRVSLPKRDSDRDAERDSSGTLAGQQRDKEEDRIIQDNTGNISSLRSDTIAYEFFVETVDGTEISKPRSLTPDRRKKLKARLSEHGLDVWQEACRKLVASDYCLGRVNGFKATLEFMLRPSSFNKLIEGAYDNRAPPKPSSTPRRPKTGSAAMLDELLGDTHEPTYKPDAFDGATIEGTSSRATETGRYQENPSTAAYSISDIGGW